VRDRTRTEAGGEELVVRFGGAAADAALEGGIRGEIVYGRGGGAGHLKRCWAGQGRKPNKIKYSELQKMLGLLL